MRKGRLIGAALAALAVAAGVIALSITGEKSQPVVEVPGGDAEHGKELIEQYGCGSCHTIGGIDSTEKYIGPPLEDLAERRYIAGDEPNNLDVLISWIQDPQAIEPGTVMPTLGVSPEEARDIAAYLYSDQ